MGGYKLGSVQGQRKGKSTAPVCGGESSSPQRMGGRPYIYEDHVDV